MQPPVAHSEEYTDKPDLTGELSQETDQLRVNLLHSLGLTTIIALFVMAALNIVQGGGFSATLDIVAALLLTALVVHLNLTGNTRTFVCTAISLAFLLLFYFFVTGGESGSAFVWSYVFPLTSFALCGRVKGLWLSFTYLFFTSGVLLTGLATDVFHIPYTADFATRYVLSYTLITLFGFLYELNIEKYKNGLLRLNNSLDRKVSERTKELLQIIEEKEEAKNEAQQARREWERTFNAVTDPILLLDTDNTIVTANGATARMFNLSLEQLTGRNYLDVLNPPAENGACCPFLPPIANCKKKSGEFYDDTLQKFFHASTSPILDDEKNCTGSIHILREISELKRAELARKDAEEKLRKSEKMETIGLMASGVAHDLNNILSGVVSYPDMLLSQMTPEDEFYGPIDTILKSGKRAAAVVDDLLTVARGVAVEKQTANLNDIALDYLNSPEFQKTHSIYPNTAVNFQLNSGKSQIYCSPVHIQKLLMNLVTNAMEAVGNNGEISIGTENRHIGPGEGKNSQVDDGDFVTITVRDNGPGIPERDLAHIFEPFYTRKQQGRSGTGLGLAIVWNIVEEHNGIIDVHSDGNGTLFSCSFRCSSGPAPAQSSREDLEELKGKGTILIVDDEPDQLHIAGKMLEALGYQTATAQSGTEAVAYCQANEVDLLFVDMLMEPGINGLETYRQILRHRPAQKAVITSGFSGSRNVTRALRSGPSRFIRKPYSMYQLGKTVKDTMSCQRATEPDPVA